MASALVSNIQGYSIHDGTGIRTVVFLKGCPLRCKWCANPENLENRIQIGFLARLCANCGRCAKTCTRGAIVPGEDVYRIDLSKCDCCFECLDTCYYDALVRYGEEMTSEEVFAKVRRDKMFYESSGGGVTVSGGEPLIHIDFVSELFRMCREEGISTCIETCGMVPSSSIERIADLTDEYYFDIKLIDPALHRKYTGADNTQILANARLLAERGEKILFRQPFIPGVNTGEEQIEATASFLKSLPGSYALQLMPYHRMGISKYEALDVPYEMKDIKVQSSEELETARKKFMDLGISCTVSR